MRGEVAGGAAWKSLVEYKRALLMAKDRLLTAKDCSARHASMRAIASMRACATGRASGVGPSLSDQNAASRADTKLQCAVSETTGCEVRERRALGRASCAMRASRTSPSQQAHSSGSDGGPMRCTAQNATSRTVIPVGRRTLGSSISTRSTVPSAAVATASLPRRLSCATNVPAGHCAHAARSADEGVTPATARVCN